MKRLSQNQMNNLMTGTSLAAELVSAHPDFRSFISTSGYLKCKTKKKFISRSLNSAEKDDIYFYIRKYEINTIYLDNDWDVTDDEIVNSVHLIDIKGIENLERQLKLMIDDLSILEGDWKCDNPL
ncbi:hypothetical protein [Cohnella mopanensis]|uniref:hypothetical protein n=1 Tax=Cohnella mopanensis TaxID=2911966 RepID=UPI001EF8D7C7|nr:hypothetical protein [Cohnella mopanensis]